MKILVAGAGYVGLSNAIALAATHDVTVVDTNPRRVELINSGRMPFQDPMGEDLVHRLCGRCAVDADFHSFDLVVIATPTDYDPDSGSFDCSSVVSVIAKCRPGQDVLIRSTIPIGFCSRQRSDINLMFAPEFLQEGSAVHDTLYPSRFILGCSGTDADRALADSLVSVCLSKPSPVIMGTLEAESVKLFANGYLAMRVAFFNELDTFCMLQGLRTESVLSGVCADPRIGTHYNNPSFGFGGYCFPKDSKQLKKECNDVFCSPLTSATVQSNSARAAIIAAELDRILKASGRTPPVLGVYSMRMKAGSDNTRSNSTQEVLSRVRSNVVIAHRSEFATFAEFESACDIILANRREPELSGCTKVFSRDVYGVN